jgi:NADPH-dependent 2,4-dienoyl-CoA reductase/sulfur reductase-like enzyme
VYSCGDAASIVDFFTGKNRPIPVWMNAYWGGRVAGMNMAGEPREYEMGMMMNSLRAFGHPVVSAGVVNPPPEWKVEVLQTEENGFRRTIFLREGRVVGYALLGEVKSAGVLSALIRSGIEIEQFQERMRKPDFALLDLPYAVRQEIREGRWNSSERS